MKTIQSRYAKTLVSTTPIKNVTCTTIKPTGSVGIKAGTESGYIYTPYIMMAETKFESEMRLKRIKREEALKDLLYSE